MAAYAHPIPSFETAITNVVNPNDRTVVKRHGDDCSVKAGFLNDEDRRLDDAVQVFCVGRSIYPAAPGGNAQSDANAHYEQDNDKNPPDVTCHHDESCLQQA